MHVCLIVTIVKSRLAKKRIQQCDLQDRVTVICTEITRDQYMSQLVDYLGYYEARFNTVISMLPSGDGLIQFVLLVIYTFIITRLCNTNNSTLRKAIFLLCILFGVTVVYKPVIRFL